MSPKLSIIIVNYNVTELLRACLSSINKFVQNIDYEVIVADNASPDSSWKMLREEFPNVKFIGLDKNYGFAIANNKAVKTAQGEYVLLLNPDTQLEGFYMKELVDFADQCANLGCVGVRMHNSDGNFLPESKRSIPDILNSFEKLFIRFNSKKRKNYYRNDIGEFDIAQVEVITGAFFMCKKKVYESVGGLDESYFMYGEDIDLCYSMLRANYKNWYYGKASILHHKGESTVKDELYLERFYGAMQIFIDKYYRNAKPLQHSFLTAGLKLKHHLAKRNLKK